MKQRTMNLIMAFLCLIAIGIYLFVAAIFWRVFKEFFTALRDHAVETVFLTVMSGCASAIACYIAGACVLLLIAAWASFGHLSKETSR